MPAPLSIEIARAAAIAAGGQLLSKRYIDATTPMLWKCAKGHKWRANLSSIRSQESWCPHCARRVKLTINDARQTARSKGGRCLSKVVKNSKARLLWECAKGHQWRAPFGLVRHRTWCPKCSGNALLTLKQLQELARTRGGRCLSTKYRRSTERLEWECQFGHRWFAPAGDIRQNRWCASCASGFGERVCRAFFEVIFQKPFPKTKSRSLKWLRISSRVSLELDGYNDELRIAFEHQGSQHFTKHNRFHTHTTLKKQLQRDRTKAKLCRDNGVALFIVEQIKGNFSFELLYEDLLRQSPTLGVELPPFSRLKTLEIKKLFHPDSRLYFENIKSIAIEKGGRCLSKEYLGALQPLNFSCKKGHRWRATPSKIKTGQWCRKCAMAASGKRQRLGIEVAKELAKAQEGECLSTRYKNTSQHLTWKCKNLHVWRAGLGSVKGGTWCRKCAAKSNGIARRLTINDAKETARQYGGECLSTKLSHRSQKLIWKCENNHQWYSTLFNVRNNKNWCPLCRQERRLERKTGAK